MLRRALLLLALLPAPAALSQEAPAPWRDEGTGCWYLRAGQALTPRLRRDGTPDCPAAPPAVPVTAAPAPAAGSRWGENVDDRATRDLARAVERLEREMSALRQAIERQAR